MNMNLDEALGNVECVYSDIVAIANDMVGGIVADVNALIEEASNNIESLTNDEIRALMLKVSFKAFSLGETKEKSALKAECAKIVRDEAYATKFNGTEGKVDERKNATTLQISQEIVVNALYELTADLLKAKLDGCYRVVDALKTVLMSRANDAKLSSLAAGE